MSPDPTPARDYLDRSLSLLWNGLPPAPKGPRRTLTLERIVDTAITVADTEGLEALSMRRLARDLSVGTMSLYRYVPDKSVLLDLMLDAVSAPGTLTRTAVDGDWREMLAASAREGRQLYLHHPWMLDVNWTRPVLGPGSVQAMELLMTVLDTLPMNDQEKVMVISSVDGYVVGTVRQQIQYDTAVDAVGVSDEEFWDAQLPYLERAMGSGDYPTMAQMSEDTFDGGWEDTFELGLQLLLDGLERELERRSSGS